VAKTFATVRRIAFVLAFVFRSLTCFSQINLYPADSIIVTVGSDTLVSPFAGGINYPLWSSIDVDGDNILDLFCYDRTNDRISVFVNDGTSSAHPFRYAPEYISRFPKPPPSSWAKCVDYNCDGKMDYFTVDSLYAGVAVWRNDYSISTGLVFTRVTWRLMETSIMNPVPFPLFATSILIPTFIDVDNDGDMDILGFNSSGNGRIAYHRNRSMQDYGVCDSLKFVYESKCWGNFQFCFGTNKVCAFNDTCAPPMSSFEEPQYHPEEAAPRDDTVTTIFSLDVDGNGLKDILIGDMASGNTLLVHNGGTLQLANADDQDTLFPSYDSPVNISEFVFHSYLDADNDGKRDLIASAGFNEDKNGVWFYGNVGTDAAPIFNLVKENFIQGDMIDEGEAAAPVLFDYDSDGLLDLVIGHGEFDSISVVNKLALFKNTGTLSQPAFELLTSDYATLSIYSLQTPIYPAFGDMDSDGDYDLLVGDNSGKMYYFDNTAGAGNIPNYQFVSNAYMGIDIGNAATPQIIDLDRDGLKDIVIGEQNGTLNFCKNIGTAGSPLFNSLPTIDTLGLVNVQHSSLNGFAVPFVFLHNSVYEMLVSNINGDVFHFTNIEANLGGTFNSVDTLIVDSLGVRDNGINLTVSGGDLNSDGKTDFAIGLFSGGIKIYYSDAAIVGIDESDVTPALFEVFPNPANSSITVRFNGHGYGKEEELIIYNSIGEKVFSSKKRNNSFIIIDTNEFSSGIYLLQVINAKSTQFKKIVVNH
jgi:hypothetical protein